jgi:Xaa-Pro aminopeptidase
VNGARAERLERRLAEREIDALLVTGLVNIRYLTGFSGTNAVAIVGGGKRVFLTDFRYVERAKAEVRDFELARGGRDLLAGAAERLSGRVGFEDHVMSVRQRERLGELVGEGVELVPAGGLVEELRKVKDESELAAIREAARLADEVYDLLPGMSVVGRSEREVAFELELEMRRRGAEPSFPSIVAAGENGALPHAVPRPGPPIPDGTLLIVDMGAQLDGYCSDCTRTFATGPLSGEAASVYELVLDAQRTALDAVRAGAGCRELDSVARGLIDAVGQGERFGHGLGHGVGLEVHEEPRLAQTADCELAAGNVVTVEPGVYLPGEFGVRIEDLVVVTDGGREIVSGFTKELVTLH